MNDTSEQPQFKTCNNPDCPCKNPQLVARFHRHKTGKDGLRSRCKTCVNAENLRRWHNTDPEVRKAISLRWRENNREAHRRLSLRYYYNNTDRYRAASRRWRKAHPERYKIDEFRRKDREKNLPNSLTANDWQQALNYFQGCCAYCGNPPGLFNNMMMAADHWIPISDPGCPGTIPENIVPACKSCNSSKKDKFPEQWLIYKFGKRKAKQILDRIKVYFASLQEKQNES